MTFYVIGTPIGNLEDVTFRALRILKEVDLILCEDTRVTGKLMAKYDIGTPTMSYPSDTLRAGHSQSKTSKIDKILDMIEKGKTLALVSDAGTPTISDPGSLLVAKIREKFSDIEIVTIPGASAVTAALAASGLPASDFLFLGFLPHKKGRETLFKEIEGSRRTVVFYESPHRILKTLEALAGKIGGERRLAISRELTKIYEETISGTPAEVLSYFQTNSDKVRGEFVVMVEGK